MRNLRRRFLAVAMSFAMLLSLLPAQALAAEEQSTDGLCPHHTEHTEACGYVAEQAEVPCDKDCVDTDGDGILDHVEGCSYAPAVAGQPCRYHCAICPVQEVIDALPDVTAENAAEVEARLTDIDQQLSLLSDEEKAELDMKRYDTAVAALEAMTVSEPLLRTMALYLCRRQSILP